VGCLPITNPLIEELYALAEMARAHERPIAVHIFPFRMDADYAEALKQGSKHQAFWQELEPIYQFFTDHHRMPLVSVKTSGAYAME
ncbi:MAG: hypothetical protein AAF597_12230, partial [Bacteroidota bacterium]